MMKAINVKLEIIDIENLRVQAEYWGLNVSAYIRMLIKKDGNAIEKDKKMQ